MFEENDSVSLETNTVPEGVPSEAQGTSSAEFDVERVDNIGQLREHVKGLKSDLETYKSTHSFVEESFGDLENARLAQQLYSGIVAEDFQPEKFAEILMDISPSRAQALVEKFALDKALPIAEKRVYDMFGGEPTPEEVSLFKQWRESGYMITNEEDIPDAFKFDAYGNPLSDEQVNAFREQFKMLNELRSRVENQVKSVEEKTQIEEQNRYYEEINQRVNDFDRNNLKVLDADLAKVGLAISEADSPDVRQEKELVREFLVGGVGRLFLSRPELARDYQTALSHLQNGEVRLARRYEPKIQRGLLEIMRSEPISKLLGSFVPNAPKQARPEISNSGVSAPTGVTAGSREERIRQLIASGALKV